MIPALDPIAFTISMFAMTAAFAWLVLLPTIGLLHVIGAI